MKVAFLAGSTHKIPRLGGEARVFHIAKTLASNGIEVDLFGSTFSTELMSPKMSQRRLFRNWSGGDWYPFSVKGAPTLLRNIPDIVRENRLLRGYDVAIVELGSAWQALFSKQISGIPIVLDEHNVEWQLMRQQEASQKKSYPWNRLHIYERICHRASDKVIVVSATDKVAFQTDGTPPAKMTVVPNGVDTAAFEPRDDLRAMVRSRLALRDNEPLLMYMGSMKFFPNVDAVNTILQTIYPQARKILPTLRLMITGPGSDQLRSDSDSDVILTGVVDRQMLPAYINAADICLAPLRFGSGTRFKILEWMSCGRPIVATVKAAEGIEVTSREDIILEDDIQKYPSLIADLWHDPNLRDRLGRKARSLVERMYSWEVCVAPLERILKEESNPVRSAR